MAGNVTKLPPSALFVGVDPSLTNTGVVLIGTDGSVLGAYNSKLSPKVPKRSMPDFDLLRLDGIARFAVDAITRHTPKCWNCRVHVAYEDYSMHSEHRAFALGELGGVLKVALFTAFGHLVTVAPTRLKKFATGTGTATKKAMVARAATESAHLTSLPRAQRTDDVCDAYFLAKYAWYVFAPEAAAEHETHRDLVRTRLELALETRRSATGEKRAAKPKINFPQPDGCAKKHRAKR
jgi:Holliday junction resolvasome RuvABC endonuclease subunit